MGGQVIEIFATSQNHINAMDMTEGYGDGDNPVILKSEFIMSLCEQLMGNTVLTAREKSHIDRCTASVYRYYLQGNCSGAASTLQDFREDYANLWYGLPGGGSDDIVDVALSQVGNVGG